MFAAACEEFLGRTEDDIISALQETIVSATP